ncbi:hypothetical protein CIB48_g9082 [Xylaria polymorpha]|nr:hypothetical protein CIB48_g9082 [Xylaria polymorpha]
MDTGQQPSLEDSRPSSVVSLEKAQSTTSPELGTTTKKEKGRVRFNSTADVEPPAFIHQLNTLKAPQEGASPAKPKPSLLRGSPYNSATTLPDEDERRDVAMSAAQERARHVAATVSGSHSAPASTRTSLGSEAETVDSTGQSIRLHDLPVQLANWQLNDGHSGGQENKSSEQSRALKQEAYNLVRSHTLRGRRFDFHQLTPSLAGNTSVSATPTENGDAELYVPPPQQFRGSTLANLLMLYKQRDESRPPSYHSPSGYQSPRSDYGDAIPGSSGIATPTRKKWYDKDRSTDTLANLVEASARLANVATESSTSEKRRKRPKHKRRSSSRLLKLGRPRIEDEIRITINIAQTLSRQRYIIKMCKALMMYGAPTHRLEEYLTMTARVLEIDGQFLYLPGCMIISFDDKQTHTTEVKIVRTNQGIDLGKLQDIHDIYKNVLHDIYGVDEAIDRLSTIMTAKDKFHPWIRVLVFGLASAAVAPFAFGGSSEISSVQQFVRDQCDHIDQFSCKGFWEHQRREFVLFFSSGTKFHSTDPPGLVLSSALELQSRALVPGSIRLVYAVIYSLFLGFGITVGTVLYGLFDSNATSATVCDNTMNPHLAFIFVPLFTICLAIVNQAKWKQLPVMVLISFIGYLVNFFSSPRFTAAPQIANTLGAFTVGVCANLYSRLRHGVAAAALLPAIFVQVPSGLAATGSLLSGLNAANKINNNTHPVDGTPTVPFDNNTISDVVFNVAGSMIQIAIGITLGLFLSALIVYPLGKRRSGLWTL